jgi:anaerobic dimethyl sulfoxide reductase subunit A
MPGDTVDLVGDGTARQQDYYNVGAALQLESSPFRRLSKLHIVANFRVDKILFGPISYDPLLSYRLALSYRFTPRTVAKLIAGRAFQTPSGKIEILSTQLAQIKDWTRTQYGYPIPAIPKWIEPFEWLGDTGKAAKHPFHLISPHPRWRTHSIFNNIPWLRETYQQEVTIAARDAERLGIRTGDVVEVWNERGKVVVPAYVTERCMPGVLVLHEGAWMDLDDKGVDRAGNPDFLTLDEPSPAGAFAYNTVLCNIRKTDLDHRPGWDQLATARSHVFRRGD